MMVVLCALLGLVGFIAAVTAIMEDETQWRRLGVGVAMFGAALAWSGTTPQLPALHAAPGEFR